ncbi:MAG TPA: glycosyltransferase family 2 protein [Candidatus Nanoarchaeia archaeon]|nr:glycosyltransferase family 2 protein [Candidatus Nanoarchaeia archaeon]
MNPIYSIFVVLIWFLSTYFAVFLLLVLLGARKNLFLSPALTEDDELPKVSLILPAFNEEKTIAKSLDSLMVLDYPSDKMEILVVNDGSSDRTAEIVKDYADRVILIDNKKNKGKAACLNQGIQACHGQLIVCMDADTMANPDVLKKVVPYFKDPSVASVTVAINVKKPSNFLEKMVEIEYIVGLSLALKALSFFNAIHVTPGPFSIYRRGIFDKVGVFDEQSITEDLEIAYRIQKSGYRIENCLATRVHTVVPSTFKGLYKQRKRWYSGAISTLMQHKDVVFNRKLGVFAYTVPFTFLLVILGLVLFVYSLFLVVSNLWKTLSFFSLTDFNFISYLTVFDFDIFAINALTAFGVISIVTTIIIAFVCLSLVRIRVYSKIPGLVGFIFLFFLYQLFWATSIYSVIFGRRVKWR